MRDTFPCPHCGSQFGDKVWRDNHADVCGRVKPAAVVQAPSTFDPITLRVVSPGDRKSKFARMLAWSQKAAESREKNGIPDWTRGLLRKWKEDAA
jgi:hypothetical protein